MGARIPKRGGIEGRATGGRALRPPMLLRGGVPTLMEALDLNTSGGTYRDRRTASTPAMAAAAAKNIAKRSASYAHANPRLNKETSAITVSSRTLRSNPSPPLWREHTLALSRTNRGERGTKCVVS